MVDIDKTKTLIILLLTQTVALAFLASYCFKVNEELSNCRIDLSALRLQHDRLIRDNESQQRILERKDNEIVQLQDEINSNNFLENRLNAADEMCKELLRHKYGAAFSVNIAGFYVNYPWTDNDEDIRNLCGSYRADALKIGHTENRRRLN